MRSRDYRFFAVGHSFSAIGAQATSMAIGWELYERTGDALVLGGIGLMQALPILFFALPGGHLADRYDRKKIVITTQFIRICSMIALAYLSYIKGPVSAMYACLFVDATTRAFTLPARSSLLPQLVPLHVFANAVTWNGSIFHVASVLGPSIGGILISYSGKAMLVYLAEAVAAGIFLVCMCKVQGRQQVKSNEPMTIESLLAGFSFVKKTKVILATLTLDLFAVLFGGITILLPMFAKDILHVGPTGLGWLRAASSLGSFAMLMTLAHYPPTKNAGKALLWSVAGFGLAIILFGLSEWFWLSLILLIVTGATDAVSVVVRHTLVQIRTPDALRGRVTAVNSIFIGLSNEFGDFESGLVAAWMGPVFAAVSGGVCAILVVLGVAWIWPEVCKLKDLKPTKE